MSIEQQDFPIGKYSFPNHRLLNVNSFLSVNNKSYQMTVGSPLPLLDWSVLLHTVSTTKTMDNNLSPRSPRILCSTFCTMRDSQKGRNFLATFWLDFSMCCGQGMGLLHQSGLII